MAGHTPGPWLIAKPKSGARLEERNDKLIHTQDRKCVAEVFQYQNHNNPNVATEANARLIAAAPDLLEAAKDALREADWWIRAKTWENDEDFERNLQKLDSVRNAIAKAEGKP